MKFAHAPSSSVGLPSRKRIAVYVTLGATLLIAVLGFRLWLDRQSVHDYSTHRRTDRSLLVLDEREMDEYFFPAFEFRRAVIDGEAQVTFNAGWCLQAYRAKRGQEVTPLDRVVTAAVLDAWTEPWMQRQVRRQLDEIEAANFKDVDSDAMSRLNHRFVEGLVADEETRKKLRLAMTESARKLDQPIRWEEDIR